MDEQVLGCLNGTQVRSELRLPCGACLRWFCLIVLAIGQVHQRSITKKRQFIT